MSHVLGHGAFTVSDGIRAALADAVHAQPLNSWPVASRLTSWLRAIARHQADQSEPPHVECVS
ncbi:hypothetical protein AB0K51_24255 [Kitasatospora sp. NPDC049285]|uniref:hypothetical protein n=1 Tax=Kitasatospora sp. NPDC049285 TaxID=3157096 RepID=UPI00343EE6B0